MADNTIFLGGSDNGRQELFVEMANRHGLVTGATGTGKTVTLQIMAEGFSRLGVPVFAADIKGDLSGISQEGKPQDFLVERARKIGFDDYGFEAFPTIFWDLFGVQGHPEVQAAIHDAIKRIKASGKPAGILTPDEATARKYIAWGTTFTAVGLDALLLRSEADKLAAKFKH